MKRARPLQALPPGIRLRDFDWEPMCTLPTKKPKHSEAEKLAYQAKKRLADFERRWNRDELAYLKRRAKALEASVLADKEWLRIEREREDRRMEADAELKAVQDYYAGEKDKELRAKLARITKELNKDICKAEREALARRGAIRGRHTPR